MTCFVIKHWRNAELPNLLATELHNVKITFVIKSENVIATLKSAKLHINQSVCVQPSLCTTVFLWHI